MLCRGSYEDALQESFDDPSSSLPNHHFDDELDKHMLQICTDVKYVKRRPKFVAVGMFQVLFISPSLVILRSHAA